MAKGNGKVEGAIAQPLSPPSANCEFIIGGTSIYVPALSLAVIERAKVSLLAMGPGLTWMEYAGYVLDVLAEALRDSFPEYTREVLARACSMGEAQALALQFNKLLDVSGFSAGEAAAVEESPGTSTLTPLPPNSPPRESAAETSTG